MHAFVIERYGSDQGRWLPWQKPKPGEGEVLIKVKAIGLNFADCMARLGVYPRTPQPPFIPGMEITGVVEAVGSKREQSWLNQKVMAIPIFGGHGEYAVVPITHVMPMPPGVSHTEASAFMVVFLTAYYGLKTLGCAKKGQRVIITAGAGGVGLALCQLARLWDLEVWAIVGKPYKAPIPLQYGAHRVLVRREKKFWDKLPKEVDLILDSVGGKLFHRLYQRLAPGGKAITFGFASPIKAQGIAKLKAIRNYLAMGFFHPLPLVSRNHTLSGFNLSLINPERAGLREAAEGLMELWQEGKIKPVIGRIWSKDGLKDAYDALQQGKTWGKQVVILS